MKTNGLISLLFLLWSCGTETKAPEQRAPVPEPPSLHSFEQIAELPVQPHHGWIACGGGWTAGQGARLGAGYADLLGEKVINAGIAGETLSGLLRRLPTLLGRQPGGLILEIGREDEMQDITRKAFQNHLSALSRQLSTQPELKLLVIASTREETYLAPIREFAKNQGAPLMSGQYFAHPPTPQTQQILANQLRELLY